MFNIKNLAHYFIVGLTPTEQPVLNWESVEQLPKPVIEEIQGNRRIAEQLNAAGKELPGNLTEFILDTDDLGRYGEEVFFRAGFAPASESEHPYALLLGKEGGRDDIGKELYEAIEERKLKPVMERVFKNARNLELKSTDNFPVFNFDNDLGKFELRILAPKEWFLDSLTNSKRTQFEIKSLSESLPLEISVKAEGVKAPDFLKEILKKNNLVASMTYSLNETDA